MCGRWPSVCAAGYLMSQCDRSFWPLPPVTGNRGDASLLDPGGIRPMLKGASQFVVNVECAVVKDGRYLMSLRGYDVGHAPGVLAFPGGKVETGDGPSDVLETTARRETLEETGVQVAGDLQYVRSTTFVVTGDRHALDVLFIGEYESGEPTISDAAEVADIRWMTTEEILLHPKTPPWLKVSVVQAESVRLCRNRPHHTLG